MTVAPVAEVTDRFRFSGSLDAGEGTRKEWQHFIVRSGSAHAIVNLSLTETADEPGVMAARTIVLAHDGSAWRGWIEEHAPDEVVVEERRIGARFGPTVLDVLDGRYRLEIALPDGGPRGQIVLAPLTEAVVMSNQRLGHDGRFSWLFVPHLAAEGWLVADGRRWSMRDAAAYHDHNWGRFEWGDDFGWEWSSLLSDDGRWSAVIWRVTDRSHHASFGRGAMVWREGRLVGVWRDDELTIEHSGHLGRQPDVTVPVELSLLRDGTASDVPATIWYRGRNGDGDQITIEVQPSCTARVLVPSDRSLRSVATLHEIHADARLSGVIDGIEVEGGGSGVVELVR